MGISLLTIGLVTLASIIGSFGAIHLKKGSGSFSFNPLKIIKNYQLVIGTICYGLATILYMIALKNEELSVVYPLVSMTYIFISFLSIKMLNEKMRVWRWLGVFIIICGIILIGLGS